MSMLSRFRMPPFVLGLTSFLFFIQVHAKAGPYAPRNGVTEGEQSAKSAAKAQRLFDSASSLIRESRYAEAVRLLRQADALSPQSPGIHHYLGYALWKQDQWGAAEIEFEKANQLDAKNPYTLY